MRAYGTGQAAMQRGTICESPLDLELRGFIWRQLSPDPCQASWRRGRLVSMSFTREKNPCTHKMRLGAWAQWAVAHKAIVRCQQLVLRARRATLVGSSQTTTAVGVTPHP